MGLKGISYSKFSNFSSVPAIITPWEIDILEILAQDARVECWTLDAGR